MVVVGEVHHVDQDKLIMKKLFFLSVCVCMWSQLHAQIYSYPALSKQFSTSYATGSARMQGMGGNYGVLGADLSSIAGNPAGLGFYSRSEVGMNVGVLDAQSSSSYLMQSSQATNTTLHLPNLGVVITGDYMNRSDWRGTFGLSYSQRAVFTQSMNIQGTNNRSSYLDQLIEKANSRYTYTDGKDVDGNIIDDEYDTYYEAATTPEGVAYQTFLINVNAKTGGAPFNRFEPNLPTNQIGEASNSGVISQWNFSYGANYKERLFVGIGLHFSKLKSINDYSWSEEFVGAEYIGAFESVEKLETTGSGISATLGLIYKLSPSLRMSMAVESPMYYDQMSERLTGTMYPKVFGVPSELNGAPIVITKVNPVRLLPNEFTYQMTTPVKFSAGAAYFLGKRALFSLDAEYVNYPGIHLASTELGAYANERFQAKYNGQVKANYQSVLNLKAGAEIRISSSWSIRGGAASYGNVYASGFDSIDRSQFQISGGLGYRTNAYYIDLGVWQRTGKDAFTPYTLKNAADYGSAALQLTHTQFVIGGGVYF